MSPLTPTPTRPAPGDHRARIVAEAVVSAYLNEITPTTRRVQRARIKPGCPDTAPRTFARAPLSDRTRGRGAVPRRRVAMPVGA